MNKFSHLIHHFASSYDNNELEKMSRLADMARTAEVSSIFPIMPWAHDQQLRFLVDSAVRSATSPKEEGSIEGRNFGGSFSAFKRLILRHYLVTSTFGKKRL